jgi:hypothetical protein
MSAARQLLMKEKRLLLFPIASTAALLLLTAVWAAPPLIETFTDTSWSGAVPQSGLPSYGDAFLFYLVTYAVAIFFNAALVVCVLRNLEGEPVSTLGAFRETVGLFPQIIGWALLSATIGMVLKTIERRSGFIGGVVVKLIGLSWTVTTFLVIPVVVAEGKGPIDAVRESMQLLRRTWGEDLLAGIGFGALYFFLAIPGALAFVVGAGSIASHPIVAVIVMTLAILYFSLLGLVLTTLSTIFDVVLYRYAKSGTITPGFDLALLDSSFITK